MESVDEMKTLIAIAEGDLFVACEEEVFDLRISYYSRIYVEISSYLA